MQTAIVKMFETKLAEKIAETEERLDPNEFLHKMKT